MLTVNLYGNRDAGTIVRQAGQKFGKGHLHLLWLHNDVKILTWGLLSTNIWTKTLLHFMASDECLRIEGCRAWQELMYEENAKILLVDSIRRAPLPPCPLRPHALASLHWNFVLQVAISARISVWNFVHIFEKREPLSLAERFAISFNRFSQSMISCSGGWSG